MLLLSTFVLLFLPLFASADVSIVLEGNRGKTTFTKTLRIKGSKMRIENRYGSNVRVTIYDLEVGKRFRLDPVRKEVFVVDLEAGSKWWKDEEIEKRLARKIQPTGNRTEVSGIPCDEYSFELMAALKPWRGEINGAIQIAHDNGTVCVSQSIPAGAEYTAFIHEAKRRGCTARRNTIYYIDSTLFPRREPSIWLYLVKT
jgi:hypothetical protein